MSAYYYSAGWGQSSFSTPAIQIDSDGNYHISVKIRDGLFPGTSDAMKYRTNSGAGDGLYSTWYDGISLGRNSIARSESTSINYFTYIYGGKIRIYNYPGWVGTDIVTGATYYPSITVDDTGVPVLAYVVGGTLWAAKAGSPVSFVQIDTDTTNNNSPIIMMKGQTGVIVHDKTINANKEIIVTSFGF